MRTKSVPSKNLLSPTEVAAALSISSKKVISLCNSGKLPCFRFGDQIRVDAEDLAAFLEKSKVRSEGACCAI
jgi:excisionase family DNA binding protein